LSSGIGVAKQFCGVYTDVDIAANGISGVSRDVCGIHLPVERAAAAGRGGKSAGTERDSKHSAPIISDANLGSLLVDPNLVRQCPSSIWRVN
jgi:hypothetical protein